MTRRGLLAVAAIALTGCGGSAGEARDVTLVLDWTPNTNHAGIYLAQANGWYDAAGLDLRLIQPGESSSLALLGSGEAEVAVTVAEQLVPARAEGVPVVSLAAVIQHNTSSLAALADQRVERPADLEGLRYGGFGGQLERELVERLVACDGGDPTTVEFVEVGNVDYRVGLERDHYDFVWIFDGWDGIRLAELEGVAIDSLPFIDYTECIPDWYTPVIATTEETVEQDPDLLRDFMEATARGYRTAMMDPQAAAEALLEGAPELDRELVERSAAYLAERYAEDPDAWGRQDGAVWDAFAAFLVDAELIAEPIAIEAAFTNEFLPE